MTAVLRRLRELLQHDLARAQPRLRLAQLAVRLMPYGMLGWLRPLCYRLAGLHMGSRGRILGRITMTGEGPVARNTHVGDDCLLTTPLFLNASAPITIGNHVTIGHHVTIITDTHDYSDPRHRGGARRSLPVTIEDGVWVAAQVTILPGVTLGHGSVVAAGAVVLRDVPPDTLVGGVPARVLKSLGTRTSKASAAPASAGRDNARASAPYTLYRR